MKVLVVDDEVGICQRLQRALQKEGKINSLSLLRKIRQMGLDLDVVITISSSGDEDKAIESIRSGAIDYLRKPISLGDLRMTLFRVEQRQASKEGKSASYRVLVVDDEEELCTRVKRELDKESCRTAVAYDGLEDLDYLSYRHRPRRPRQGDPGVTTGRFQLPAQANLTRRTHHLGREGG